MKPQKPKSAFPITTIEARIHLVRGHKVILDRDLAELYGVSTKALNQAVKRNNERFPDEFLFRLTQEEVNSLRSQIVTLNPSDSQRVGTDVLRSQNVTSKETRGGRRNLPYAFTEHGALMVANVLRSPRAIQMSVLIVQTFVRLQRMFVSVDALARKFEELERTTREDRDQINQIVAAIRQLMAPPEKPRREIGFHTRLEQSDPAETDSVRRSLPLKPRNQPEPNTESTMLTPAEIDRKWAELKAEERRNQQKEQRTRLEKARREICAAAIRDGVNDLKLGVTPARWWWLRSQTEWEKFERDPYAQGYEMVRRIPELHGLLAGSILGPYYSPLPLERDPIHRPWQDLSQVEQKRFKSGFDRGLGELGFPTGGGVSAGNRAVFFDCSLPAKRIVSLVEAALENPVPLMVGSKGVTIERESSRQGSSTHQHYIKSKGIHWEPEEQTGPRARYVMLKLPPKGPDPGTERGRSLNCEDIPKVVATFLRNPPPEFRKHLDQVMREHRRLDHPNPRTLVLGFMARDFTALPGGKLMKLADWLAMQAPATLKRFELTAGPKTREKAFNDLDYAKDALEKLLNKARKRTNW